jgi:hypothetical protein
LQSGAARVFAKAARFYKKLRRRNLSSPRLRLIVTALAGVNVYVVYVPYVLGF